MITCRLNGKEYHIDFVSGRAMREMGPASEMCRRVMAVSAAVMNGEPVPEDAPKMEEAMDEMVKWFCTLFGRQFTMDEVYDHYPADQFMHDIAMALFAVQSSMTEILSEFPMKPAATGETRA